MATPPPLSSLSAATEVLVTVAVLWFLHRAYRYSDHRWGVIWTAIAYETAFNISYMTWRLFAHEEGVTHDHPAWVTWYVGTHGSLSLLMFIGLVSYVVWIRRSVSAGMPNPIARRPGLAVSFVILWMLSVLSGQGIYVMYWLDIIQT